jgi:hypothetical protein
MGKILRFTVSNGKVSIGNKERMQLTKNRRGCNEPFKDKYWCPQKRWFMNSPCTFYSQHECEIFNASCTCKGGF